MQIKASQIRVRPKATYTLWGGEVRVTVFQQRGVYGHYSAAVVAEYIDNPIETFAYNGYRGSSYGPDYKPTQGDMLQWIANVLTTLSTGTELAEGKVGDVVGLAS